MLKVSRSNIILILLAFVFVVSSCQKETIEVLPNEKSAVSSQELEQLLANYPKEITLKNWEDFVYAPQAVIDYFLEMEQQQNTTITNPSPIVETRNQTNGLVQAFNGTWQSMPGVTIIASTCQSLTTTNSNSNYNYTVSCSEGSVCMEYSTPAINGINCMDFIAIRRHILGLQYFTDARQFLAADVSRNGIISVSDLTKIRQVMLGALSFPQSDNIVFVSNDKYSDLQSTIDGNGNIDSSLLKTVGKSYKCLSSRNRRAIKTGDVTGDFNF